MSCAAKLFNKILLTRLQPVLDPFLRREQNGFRPHRGTATQILALRRVIEEARTRQATLICVFVDFRKAFDSVSRAALALVLRAYHVPQRLVSAVMALYQNTQAAVVTPDGLSDLFSTTSGVLQGYTLAHFLLCSRWTGCYAWRSPPTRTGSCCAGGQAVVIQRSACHCWAMPTTSRCCPRPVQEPNGCWTVW